MKFKGCVYVLLITLVSKTAGKFSTSGMLGVVDEAVAVTDLIVSSSINTDTPNTEDEEVTRTTITVIIKEIEASRQQLVRSIQETLTLARIDDIQFSVHSVLEDYMTYMQADGSEREARKQEFIRQASNVVTQIRSLPSRLKRTLANSETSLLMMMSESVECNMTAMYEFEMFFRNLTKMGIIIELSYKRLEHPNIILSPEKAYWHEQEVNMEEEFIEQSNSCKARFREFIKTDIENTDDTEKLSLIIREKYTWFLFDVFYLESNNAEQSFVIEGQTDDFMATELNGYKKFVWIMERGTAITNLSLHCAVLLSKRDTNTSSLFTLDSDSPAMGHFTTTTVGSSNQQTTFAYNILGSQCDAQVNIPLEKWDSDIVDDTDSDGLNTAELVGTVIGSISGVISIIVGCNICYKKWRDY